jgi:fatty acid desaturase
VHAVRRKGGKKMAGLLWALIAILFVFWLLGFMVFHLGSIIHFVLVIALIMLVVNLITGRGAKV